MTNSSAESLPDLAAPFAAGRFFALRGFALWAVAFAAVAWLSWDNREAPYFWDAMGYVQPHAQEIFDSGLSPFLHRYDVGHPTLFPWTLAALVKLSGLKWTLAGHWLTWAFAGLAFAGVYGCGRALGQPRPLALGAAAATMALPVIWANVQMVLLDLPMFALAMAATCFWARRRPVLYCLAATGAILTKLHGFFPLCGVGAALFFGSGRFWLKGRRLAFAKLAAWTYAPLLALPLFLVARILARGPEWHVGYNQPKNIVPLWETRRFVEHVPFAFEQLFQASLAVHLLVLAVPVCSAGLLALLLQRSKEPLEKVFEPSPAYDMALALVFMLIGTNAALFQMGPGLCCARYSMPTAAALVLLLTQSGFVLARRFWPLVLVPQALLIFGFVMLQHPSRAEALPEPLKSALARSPQVAGYRLEIDLRFLDATKLISWAGETIIEDAKKTGSPLGARSLWPIDVAFNVPRMGYVDERIETQLFDYGEGWAGIDPKTHPYVVSMSLITGFSGPPEGVHAEVFAEKTVGELTAAVWRVFPPAEEAAPPAPEPEQLAPAEAPAPETSGAVPASAEESPAPAEAAPPSETAPETPEAPAPSE